MRQVDVVIVGAGLTGSLAAAMLGRRGYSVTLIDPHEHYRPDFRCEKLEQPHVDALRDTGLLDEILPAARYYKGVRVARLGRLCENKPSEEYGIDYSTLVNRIRALIPSDVVRIQDTVRTVAVTSDRQVVTLQSGETVSARLVIAANGLNAAMLASLGMHRREISKCHSISIGFDIEPAAGSRGFDALTYFGEAPEHRVSYITFFPMGSGMRANLFVYRTSDDPWLRRFREAPASVLAEAMPRLKRLIGDFNVVGSIKFRPVDLYVTESVVQPGIALVGDAYASACPVSGTGASKGIIDVERLCNVYVPEWLATPGMAAAKIAAFYADPVKAASDANSMATSLFAKRLALLPGLQWTAYRAARFAGSFARGVLSRQPAAIAARPNLAKQS